MKFILLLLNIFYTFSLIGDDYILNLTGKRVYNTAHNYTKKDNYRIFELEGAFTDNLGNYHSKCRNRKQFFKIPCL